MANQSHLDVLKQGTQEWNAWRAAHPEVTQPDLSGVDLERVYLEGAHLGGAHLEGAYLRRAYLRRANLMEADLRRADLRRTDLFQSDLRKADLSGARLRAANLRKANLEGAHLRGAIMLRADLSKAHLQEADLREAELRQANLTVARLDRANLEGAKLNAATLVETNLESANLTGSSVYGVAAWNVKLEGAKQHNLNISAYGEPAVTVDNLEVAQFIYLLLENEKLRQVIDTVTSKVVLILGRFTPERKTVLEALRDSLRQHDYLPVLFDFAKPTSRDLTETISTLAHMARFIIADITEAKSIPQELQAIVPNLPSVPVQPLLLNSDREYGMFEHFRRFPWVLETYYYDNLNEVLLSVEDKVITPAETKARELSS
jgi:uncharacterized protein YjbI with pentapeptide repeats